MPGAERVEWLAQGVQVLTLSAAAAAAGQLQVQVQPLHTAQRANLTSTFKCYHLPVVMVQYK